MLLWVRVFGRCELGIGLGDIVDYDRRQLWLDNRTEEIENKTYILIPSDHIQDSSSRHYLRQIAQFESLFTVLVQRYTQVLD